MSDLSTEYPHFSKLTFRKEVDRFGDWAAQNVPWHTIRVQRLHTRDEFMPGASYGRNGWNELYKGETVKRLYVAVPEAIISRSNVRVIYRDMVMLILKDAQPALVRERRGNQVGLMHFYPWMGVIV